MMKTIPESAESVTPKTAETAVEAVKLLTELRARWPILAEARPLKLGVRQDIRAALEGVSGVRISRAVLLHIATAEYQAALAAGGARYALDGSPAGEVTAKEARHAKAILDGKASFPATKPKRKKPKRVKASKASPPESTKPATTLPPQRQSEPPTPKPVESAQPPATAVRPILRLKPKTGAVTTVTINRKDGKP